MNCGCEIHILNQKSQAGQKICPRPARIAPDRARNPPVNENSRESPSSCAWTIREFPVLGTRRARENEWECGILGNFGHFGHIGHFRSRAPVATSALNWCACVRKVASLFSNLVFFPFFGLSLFNSSWWDMDGAFYIYIESIAIKTRNKNNKMELLIQKNVIFYLLGMWNFLRWNYSMSKSLSEREHIQWIIKPTCVANVFSFNFYFNHDIDIGQI